MERHRIGPGVPMRDKPLSCHLLLAASPHALAADWRDPDFRIRVYRLASSYFVQASGRLMIVADLL